jgi:radical SAM protein with 4Fe4S-binding SPASM domain
MLIDYSPSLKERAEQRYFQLARTTPLGKLHQALRIWHHQRRYGVKSSFMFRAVELEINSMCNRKCGYCPNISDKRPLGYMEENLFFKIIDELSAIDFDGRISYHFYGEPLLDKRLPRFVAESKKRVPKSRTEIYSNGDFLTLEKFREYIALGLDNFLITQHDNIIPPNLQNILDNITAAERQHIVVRFAKDRFMINRSGLITTLNVVNEPLNVPCDWPLTSMVVTMAGNVVLCCNDYYETEVIGNLKSQTLREVWTDARFEKFRRALSRGDRTVSKLCEDCDYVPRERHLQRVVPG